MKGVLGLLVVVVVLSVGGVWCMGAEAATRSAVVDMELLWKDLLGDEAAATRAILAMAKRPDDATVFLAGKLRPLTLSEERLRALLAQLGSKDEAQWKTAYRELEYFDPRLAMGLEELMGLKVVSEYPARNRLVDVLSGRPFGEVWPVGRREESIITLSKFGPPGNESYNFVSTPKGSTNGVSWWAEKRVQQLNTEYSNSKREWTRVVRALALLESIGTSDAVAVIESMASGHPEAQPTKVAEEMIVRLSRR